MKTKIYLLTSFTTGVVVGLITYLAKKSGATPGDIILGTTLATLNLVCCFTVLWLSDDVRLPLDGMRSWLLRKLHHALTPGTDYTIQAGDFVHDTVQNGRVFQVIDVNWALLAGAFRYSPNTTSVIVLPLWHMTRVNRDDVVCTDTTGWRLR